MNNNDLKNSLDKLSPDSIQKKSMLSAIQSGKKIRRPNFAFSKIAPIAAVLVIVVAAVAFVSTLSTLPLAGTNDGTNPTISEGALAPADERFTLDGKNYTLYSYDNLPFSPDVSADQVGEQIATANIDDTEQDIYEYLPADGAEIAVVVEKENDYQLFVFSGFESLSNPSQNKDADMADYLKVYGVTSADDIEKVVLTFTSTETTGSSVALSNDRTETIDSREVINEIYPIVSELSDNSEKYFQLLEQYIPKSDTSNSDIDSEGDGNTGSQGGTTALENSVMVTAVLKSGLEMEFHYYPNIYFLNRYEIPPQYRNIIDSYLKP